MKRKYSEITDEGDELNIRPNKKKKINHNFNYLQLLFQIDQRLNDLEKNISSKIKSIEERLNRLEQKPKVFNKKEVPSYII